MTFELPNLATIFLLNAVYRWNINVNNIEVWRGWNEGLNFNSSLNLAIYNINEISKNKQRTQSNSNQQNSSKSNNNNNQSPTPTPEKVIPDFSSKINELESKADDFSYYNIGDCSGIKSYKSSYSQFEINRVRSELRKLEREMRDYGVGFEYSSDISNIERKLNKAEDCYDEME